MEQWHPWLRSTKRYTVKEASSVWPSVPVIPWSLQSSAFYQEGRHLEGHLAEMEASQGHYSLKQGFIRAKAEKTHKTMVLTLGAHLTRQTHSRRTH